MRKRSSQIPLGNRVETNMSPVSTPDLLKSNRCRHNHMNGTTFVTVSVVWVMLTLVIVSVVTLSSVFGYGALTIYHQVIDASARQNMATRLYTTGISVEQPLTQKGIESDPSEPSTHQMGQALTLGQGLSGNVVHKATAYPALKSSGFRTYSQAGRLDP